MQPTPTKPLGLTALLVFASIGIAVASTTPGRTGTTRGPTGTTHGPTGTSQRPTSTTQGPTGTTQGPTGTTHGPTGTSQGPTGTTQGPTGTTQGLTGTTQGPTGTTQGPTGTTSRPGTTGLPETSTSSVQTTDISTTLPTTNTEEETTSQPTSEPTTEPTTYNATEPTTPPPPCKRFPDLSCKLQRGKCVKEVAGEEAKCDDGMTRAHDNTDFKLCDGDLEFCCVPKGEDKCKARGGTCQRNPSAKFTCCGYFEKDLCKDPDYDIQCCLPAFNLPE